MLAAADVAARHPATAETVITRDGLDRGVYGTASTTSRVYEFARAGVKE